MRLRLGGWVTMLLIMILFLTLVGVPPAGTENVLGMIGFTVSHTTEEIGFSPTTSTFWQWVIGALAVLGVGGSVAIGLFGKGYDPSLIYAPIIVSIGGLFITSFVSVFSMVNSYEQFWITSIVVIIFGGLAGGFIMACLDYFGGR